jgi:DNA-binding GntR family transcriptional regulator
MPPDSRPTFRTKQEFVYHQLRTGVLTCDLQPGQRLVIEDIARRYQVSTIPVREALQLLQSEGLVAMTPHVGATVAPLSRDSVLDVFTVLEGLQVVAARLAATTADEATRERLAAAVADMDRALAEERYEEWADVNTRFHATLGSLPGLTLLARANAQALDRWDRIRRYFYRGVLVPRVAQAQRDHHAIIDALAARDASLVADLVRQHYEAALGSYLRYLDEGN